MRNPGANPSYRSMVVSDSPREPIHFPPMCLSIPMQIVSIDGLTARCEAKGAQRDVSLFLLQDAPPRVGDFVSVSLGNAILRVSPEDARLAWELFDQILAELGS